MPLILSFVCLMQWWCNPLWGWRTSKTHCSVSNMVKAWILA